jgi:hypothetical protein
VAGVFFEVLGDGLDRRGEVGCDGNLDFIGPGAVEENRLARVAAARWDRRIRIEKAPRDGWLSLWC